MQGKRILFGKEAREELKKGLDTVVNAVSPTIGSMGRNVVIDKGFQQPQVSNDGTTCADSIRLGDSAQRMGAEIGKNVARKTNDEAGDGTTTSLVLTKAIFDGGLQYINKGVNIISLKKGIDKATAYVVERLKEFSRPIIDLKEIEQVATISAESEEIGKLIAQTVQDIGKEGVITVVDSPTVGITSEIVEGMEIQRGFISPAMMTNFEKGISEQNDVPVLLTDKKLVMVNDLLPLLESIIASGRKELFIVAEDVEGEALATFLINKARGSLNITAIKATGFGNGKKDILSDIAVVTGGKVFFSDMADDLSKATIEDLGIVKRVVVSKDKTIIIGNNKQKEFIDARVASLKEQLKTVEGKIDRKTVEDRISKLSGGVASIKVGAVSETEQKYLKLKIEDSINATKAAIAEGIIIGGGSAFAQISKAKVVKNWMFGYRTKFDLSDLRLESKEEEIGFKIVMEAILAPIKNIALNSGKKGKEVDRIINKLQTSILVNSGYNASSGLIQVDLFQRGLIDPVKVTRTALQNAASAAGTLLTTEVLICEEDLVKNNN